MDTFLENKTNYHIIFEDKTINSVRNMSKPLKQEYLRRMVMEVKKKKVDL